MKKKIFIAGGSGYVGCHLAKKLVNMGHFVRVLDLQLYGKNLEESENLELIKGDIRNTALVDETLKGVDTVIHLACISNDPSFELNPTLGKSINLDSFQPFVSSCVKNKVKQFVYASSSSVYGIKNITNVTEEEKLNPITDYSKYKVMCENILLSNKSNMIKTIIRPATVCGYSKRLRLDLVINIITKLAFFEKKIKIFGGDQLRPNIHIDDMIDAYILMMNVSNDKINNKIYNVGYENLSLNNIAKKVQNVFGEDVKVEKIPTDDHRSYHISSNKINKELDFKPKKNIDQAITDLKEYFINNSKMEDFSQDIYYNIKRMQNINLK